MRKKRIKRIKNLRITLSQRKALIVEPLLEIITEVVKIIIMLMLMEELAMIQGRRATRRKII